MAWEARDQPCHFDPNENVGVPAGSQLLELPPSWGDRSVVSWLLVAGDFWQLLALAQVVPILGLGPARPWSSAR